MIKELSRSQAEYMLINIGIEYSLKKLLKDKWEITEDKSYDEIRNESDDAEFPYVVLRNGEFFEAITKDFKEDIFSIGDKQTLMYKKDIKAIEETVLLERECGHIICDFDDRERDLREIAEIIGVDYYIPCDDKITFFREKDKLRVEEALKYYYDLH